MKAWLEINANTIAPISYEAVVFVLSWLKGFKAGGFAQTRLAQGRNYDWATLVDEIEELFQSTNQKDWAHAQLAWCHQGNSPTNDFIIK